MRVKNIVFLCLVFLGISPIIEHLFAHAPQPLLQTAGSMIDDTEEFANEDVPFKVIRAVLKQHEAEQQELAALQKAERAELREKHFHEKNSMLRAGLAQKEKALREELTRELEALQKELDAEKEKMLQEKHAEEKADQEKHHASEQARSQVKQAVEVQLLKYKFPTSQLHMPGPSVGMPLP